VRAASRVLRNASAVEMSGAGAHSRTATPMNTRATSVRVPATNDRFSSIIAMAGAPRISTSAVSPAASLAASVPTGPKVMSTSWPLARMKSSASLLTAAVIERAQNTLILAMPVRSLLPHCRNAVVARFSSAMMLD
jgi:hypothetical protein